MSISRWKCLFHQVIFENNFKLGEQRVQGMNEDEAPAKQIGHEAKPADEGLTPDQVKQQTTDTK